MTICCRSAPQSRSSRRSASAGAPSPTLELVAAARPGARRARCLRRRSRWTAAGARSITIGYHGSYTIGRDAQANRQVPASGAHHRVCGKTSLAKEVFGDTLNGEPGPRPAPGALHLALLPQIQLPLEQAFDKLSESGFHMVACSSTGTCAFASSTDQSEDKIWTSYTKLRLLRGVSSPLPLATQRALPSFPFCPGGTLNFPSDPPRSRVSPFPTSRRPCPSLYRLQLQILSASSSSRTPLKESPDVPLHPMFPTMPRPQTDPPPGIVLQWI